MGKTFIFLAEGFEELEALSVYDVFKRAGQNVFLVSVTGSKEVTSSHGLVVKSDVLVDDIDMEDAVLLVFPGGMPGAVNLSSNAKLMDMMQMHFDLGRRIAAICASSAMVIGKIKSDEQFEITCYPGFEKEYPSAIHSDEGVVIDRNITTAKGPAYAVDFALTLLAQVASPDIAEEIAEGMLI